MSLHNNNSPRLVVRGAGTLIAAAALMAWWWGGISIRPATVLAEDAASKLTDERPAAPSKPGKLEKPPHENLSLRGRVVFLADALKRRFGIESDEDAAQQQVALETAAGQIYPLVKDARGRGFLVDPRLRDVEMELLVRRYEGSPVVQVIRVYTIKESVKYELDYWCDVCAIPMYELKPCECCQGPIRIRERRVGEGASTRDKKPSK